MGFKGDCVDINECKTGNNKCVGANVTCKNLPGGYKCPCKPGFAGDMRRGCKGKISSGWKYSEIASVRGKTDKKLYIIWSTRLDCPLNNAAYNSHSLCVSLFKMLLSRGSNGMVQYENTIICGGKWIWYLTCNSK